MQRFVTGALLAASLLGITACESMITGGPLIRPGEPTGQIVIVNNSSNVIDVVSISDCDASTYGLNRMPSSAEIPPGKTYAFTVSAGCWDVDAGSIGVGEARKRMDVGAGGITRYTVTD